MEPTGERYIKELMGAEIACEHWHRYIFAQQFVKNKAVLDIASGEGYGTNMLSRSAQTIIGIDSDEAAVTHSKEHYKNKNVTFQTGSCTNFGTDLCFDVIVSFETIEHITLDEQHRFLEQINAHLNPNGLLIISTPNKKAYSAALGAPNQFHKHELDETEFSTLLRNHFRTVTIYNQRFVPGSRIWPQGSAMPERQTETYYLGKDKSGFSPTKNDSLEAMYFIAVCSNTSLLTPPESWLIDETSSSIVQRDAYIKKLRARLSFINQIPFLGLIKKIDKILFRRR